MIRALRRRLLLLLLPLASALVLPQPSLHAQHTENYSFTIGQIIPDNDPTGLNSTQTLSSLIGSITNVQVTLTIAGGLNGDYYAFLLHSTGGGDGFSVLLNRVGRTSGNSDGYADTGFTTVTFDGSAINDIHLYQSVSNPGGGPLVGGTWTPDGRETDPLSVLDTDMRTALLSSFNTLDASGDWTLFIVDNAQFGQGTLVSWDLQITGIPEPTTWAAGMLALSLVAMRRRVVPAARAGSSE